jgi:predicted TIM-barrel fold metal-dependent hydrolase
MPSYYFEIQSQSNQTLASHLVSLIAHGVFERYPSLRLLMVEAGVAWVPGLLWKMDDQYRSVRAEVPWMKRWPSEVFQRHVRLTTQPLEGPTDRDSLIAVLDAYGAADVLCFSSDYPHWDTDQKDHVARTLPRGWHQRVFHDNAAQLYGWS